YALAAILAVAAILLSASLIEYRVEPLQFCKGSIDVVCMAPDQILSLRQVDIDPPPGSVLARVHGKTGGGGGLFARFGLPPILAAIGGMLLPLTMFISAIALAFRRSSQTSRIVAT